MALRMIEFQCSACKHEFEELVDAKDGFADPEKCPECGKEAPMIMDAARRVHRPGNRYRDVSWSTWSIA